MTYRNVSHKYVDNTYIACFIEYSFWYVLRNHIMKPRVFFAFPRFDHKLRLRIQIKIPYFTIIYGNREAEHSYKLNEM